MTKGINSSDDFDQRFIETLLSSMQLEIRGEYNHYHIVELEAQAQQDHEVICPSISSRDHMNAIPWMTVPQRGRILPVTLLELIPRRI